MKWEHHILEGIESCRPGSDDLSSPELEGVALQVAQDDGLASHVRDLQHFDKSIQHAMDDVPLPAGLETRLLASLGKTAGTAKTDVAREFKTASSRMSTRRRWIVAALATAASLAVVTGIATIYFSSEPWSIAQVKYEAVHWSAMLDDSAWQKKMPPEQFPFPMEARVRPWQWQLLHQPSEGVDKVVVYDLSPPQSALRAPRGRLFVLRTAVAHLPGTPPVRPTITEGRLVAAWRSGDHVCVLVLDKAESPVLQSYYQTWFTGSMRRA